MAGWKEGVNRKEFSRIVIANYYAIFYTMIETLRVAESKYRELLDRFKKSKTLKLCRKDAFRELSDCLRI